MIRSEAINLLIDTFGYTRYLEIGLRNVRETLDQVKVPTKVAVTPYEYGSNIIQKTSEAYFSSLPSGSQFDIILIDGEHSHVQSQRDFDWALKYIAPKGCILMHDVLPHNEEYTQPHWCGEAWKTAAEYSRRYESIVCPADHGLAIFFPSLSAEIKPSVGNTYPGLNRLKRYFGATDDVPQAIASVVQKIAGVEAVESILKATPKPTTAAHKPPEPEESMAVPVVNEVAGDNILLSILIPTLEERTAQFASLNKALTQQADGLPVEILINKDNRQKTIGQKRNELLEDATGEYICYVDDDDQVTDDYVTKIVEAIQAHKTDVVNFMVHYTSKQYTMDVYYSIKYSQDARKNFTRTNGTKYTERLPNHLMAVKRSIALRAKFPEISWQEDSEYAKRLKRLLKTEHQIPQVLYHYIFTKY